MALADLSDWLDEHTKPDIIWYVKRLSANDTGYNRTHQAGPHITKDFLFQVFPQINTTGTKNPDTRFDLYVDSHAAHHEARAVYYNSKFSDGTRNEARLTNFGGQRSVFLSPESTGALAVLAFRLDGNGAAIDCHAWVCDNAIEEDIVEEVTGPVIPGRHRVWQVNRMQPSAMSNNSCWLDTAHMPPEWLHKFPTGDEIVRKSVELRPLTKDSPDTRLVKRCECEFELFRSIEQAFELPRICTGFSSVAEFIPHAQRILQRRKSRAGRSLELHVRQIFMEVGLHEDLDFSYQPTSEGDKKPDFLFPSQAAYQNSVFPEKKLRMLAVKTTCRDRWRQITNEADRIAQKHLLTLQEGVSVPQFKEMTEAGIQLVIPDKLRGKFPKEVQPHLQTLESFIGDVRLLSVRNG